tara:strand:- start:901 stop:1209 length:309 start_codon:yes stop_codon:yes gene_type:complete
MTIGKTIRKALKELSEGILGMIGPKDFTLDDGCCGGKCKNGMTPVKPKRARTKKGRYKADDPKTKDYNEAYVGGKAPEELLGLKKKKKKKKNAKKKKSNKKR